MTNTIVTIVGARPQFIKAATISRQLAREAALDEIMVHTGQHFDDNMSQVFFDELDIPAPAYNLDISGGGHGRMTGHMLEAIEQVLQDTTPACVLVYGDTNSTLAGALAAAKLHIPVAHVEAGLRSFNKRMPEEINRVLTDHVSDLLFCPTQVSVDNLAAEGISRGVHFVGDVMYDATLFAKERAAARSAIIEEFALTPGAFTLCTVHRAENTDDPDRLQAVCDFIEARARERPVVFPVHPRTAQALDEAGRTLQNVRTVAPLGYLDMHRLLSEAALVLTDSGGLQKEAYFHRVPCVTLRDETEWVETVEAGWNRLWTESPEDRELREIPDYGTGDAGRITVELLRDWAASRS